MRDNVLIFTEDHIGPDLAELASYFNGYLRMDGRDLLRRLQLFADWQARLLASDAPLRDTVRHLLAPSPAANPAAAPDPATRARELLNRPGYVTYLSIRPAYPSRAPAPRPPGTGVGEPADQAQGVRAVPRPAALPAAGRARGQALVCRSGAAARIRRRAPGAATVAGHPPARLHGALGGRPAGLPLRHDLRHHRLLPDHLAAAARGHRGAGRVLPQDVPLPAPDQPPRRRQPAQAREVPRRRRLLLQPRRAQRAGRRGAGSSAPTAQAMPRGSPSTAACGSRSTTATIG